MNEAQRAFSGGARWLDLPGFVVLLWAAIAATAAAFWRIDRLAGALFLPYLAWVSYAALLNATIWKMN